MESSNQHSITLLGSNFSPYVRRVRLYCEANKISYNWHPITNLLERDIPEVSNNNPAKQIPILITMDDGPIWDSKVIMRYLAEKYNLQQADWKNDLIMAAINNLNDTFVTMFIAEKSGINIHDSKLMIFNRYHGRVEKLLEYFNEELKNKTMNFQGWNESSISLYCAWDWILFRKRISEEKTSQLTYLNGFLKANASSPGVASTNPRIFPK